jgi:hypothetical protein
VPGWPVPWVITNPVYVHDEASARRAPGGGVARPRRPPGSSPGPRPPEGLPAFGAEFDPSSWMDTAVAAPGAGPDGAPP